MTTPTLDLDDTTRRQLERAASLLAGVGFADPDTVSSGAALLSLAAAEQLRPLVGQPPHAIVEGERVAEALGEALATLAELPEQVFATRAVLDAADDATRAYSLLT